MRYGSVCSGIEAASAAWHPLGWTPAFFSEIDPFPCAVLKHHYPTVPNFGDMTKFEEWPDADIDVLVGGTPCQSFSVAGLRKGLRDPRGNLMLTFGAIARRYRPTWLVWENVPGVLSSAGGRDFGSFLGMLGELGYGFAYRVLDAQFFGVAQRRRRVFLVGHIRSWRPAAAVLFERESLRGDPPPQRRPGQRVAPTIAGCANGGGANGPGRDVDSCESLIPEVAKAVKMFSGGIDREDAHTLITMSSGQANAEIRTDDGAPALTCLHEAPIVAFDSTQITHPENRSNPQPGDPSPTLAKEGHPPSIAIGFNWQNGGGYGNANEGLGITEDGTGPLARKNLPAVAFKPSHYTRGKDSGPEEVVPPLTADADKGDQDAVALAGTMVRRLTPRECERLQGFPDDFTLVPYRGRPAADGPRYKALGNSMAVPVMNWIGSRIALVQEILNAQPVQD